jgi:hypothetical protein
MPQINNLNDIEAEFDEIFEGNSLKVKELIDKFQSNSRTFEQEPPWARASKIEAKPTDLHVTDSDELIGRLKNEIRKKDEELEFLKSEVEKCRMSAGEIDAAAIIESAEEVHSDVSRDLPNIRSIKSKHVKARILKVKTVFNRCLILLQHPEVSVPKLLELLTKLNVRTQRNA